MSLVLVVDDNLDTCRFLVKLIGIHDARAACVASGPEALEFVQRETPRLIFLDYMMPEMDGLDVLRALRADPKFHDVPVVIFSALADPDFKARALQAGAQDFIVKGDIGGVLRIVSQYAA